MVNVKPVTLYDVAEYAGVSYQTVSRVVNQASHVSAKTREKVEAAMAELNYIPNRVAHHHAGTQLIGARFNRRDNLRRRVQGQTGGGVDGRTKRRRSL